MAAGEAAAGEAVREAASDKRPFASVNIAGFDTKHLAQGQ